MLDKTWWPTLPKGEIVRYKKKQKIIKAGEAVDFVATLVEGAVKLYLPLGGKQVGLLAKDAFTVWSAMMVVSGAKSQLVAEAVGVVKMTKVSKQDFWKTVRSKPGLMEEFMKQIVVASFNWQATAMRIIGAQAEGKVVATVLEMADGNLPLTHKMIASMTGLTRETVTLQMIRLEKMGLLDNSNRKVVILEPDKLIKMIYGSTNKR